NPHPEVLVLEVVVAAVAHALEPAPGGHATRVIRDVAAVHRPCEVANTLGLVGRASGVYPKLEGVIPPANLRLEHLVMLVRRGVCRPLLLHGLQLSRIRRRLVRRLNDLRSEDGGGENKHRTCENAADVHVLALSTNTR